MTIMHVDLSWSVRYGFRNPCILFRNRRRWRLYCTIKINGLLEFDTWKIIINLLYASDIPRNRSYNSSLI